MQDRRGGGVVDEPGSRVTEAVSIRPGVAMLGLFQHMKYQPWYAIGELVDNAIQSYLSNRDQLHDVEGAEYGLRVEIEIDKQDGGSIVVRDNAAGIARENWARAFLVAEPPADTSGLNQFGIGMKAACCWFSRVWSVRTTHLGEQVIRSVEFDVPTIVASRDERLDVVEEPTDWRSHFTEVRMTRLHRSPQTRTIGKIREFLGAIYRQFLRDGDVEILFMGEPITYAEPAVLRTPLWSDQEGEPLTWRKDITLQLSSGRKVTGFAGIRERGSTAQAGLALFYRNKVVTGAGEDAYRPEEIFGRSNSFRSQRLFGEMHMDDFNVTYTKDALVWFEEEEEFIQLLRDELDASPLPLLRQAENHRARQPEVPVREVAGATLDQITRAIEVSQRRSEGTAAALDLPGADAFEDQGASQGQEELQVDRELDLDLGGTRWKVRLRLVTHEGNLSWLTVQRPESGARDVTLTVNQAHPFMRTFCELPGQELEPVWRVAIALGLAQELAREGGATLTSRVTARVNDLLRTVLAHRS